MDRVIIRGLEVHAHHGVLPEERRDGQRFVIDVLLETDLGPAARSDDLADTVDYGTLAARVAELAVGGPYDLIETVAGRIAELCLADPRVGAAEVTVHKPDAPVDVPVAEVAVSIRREQDRG